MEKLKRVASQPSLAIAAVPRIVKAAGGALAPALGAGPGPVPPPGGSAPAGRAGSADGDRLAAGAALLTRCECARLLLSGACVEQVTDTAPSSVGHCMLHQMTALCRAYADSRP